MRYQINHDRVVSDPRIELDVHEADAASDRPGSLHGSVTLVDAMGRELTRLELSEGDTQALLSDLWPKLRQRCLAAVGANSIDE